MPLSKEAARAVRKRYTAILAGECVCLELIGALADGRVSREDCAAAKRLEIRCPLDISGQCHKCAEARAKPRHVDMFDAVRELGLVKDAGKAAPRSPHQ